MISAMSTESPATAAHLFRAISGRIGIRRAPISRFLVEGGLSVHEQER